MEEKKDIYAKAKTFLSLFKRIWDLNVRSDKSSPLWQQEGRLFPTYVIE